MNVLLYKPGCNPAEVKIGNTLSDLQRAVGGYIETVSLADGLILVCDEEGKLKDKPPNRILYANGRDPVDIIVGNFFVCRRTGEELSGIRPGDEDLAALFLAPV